MNRTQVISIALVLLVTVATLTQGRFLADARSKRQSADVRTAEYLAWIALGGGLGPGCDDIACGMVDVDKSGKKKRDVRLGDNISDLQRFRIFRELYNNINDQS